MINVIYVKIFNLSTCESIIGVVNTDNPQYIANNSNMSGFKFIYVKRDGLEQTVINESRTYYFGNRTRNENNDEVIVCSNGSIVMPNFGDITLSEYIELVNQPDLCDFDNDEFGQVNKEKQLYR